MSGTFWVSRMNVAVETLGDHEEWDRVARECEYATFFHTPEWYSVFAGTYPNMKISTKRMVFADREAAVLPLMEQEEAPGMGKRYFSGPAGVYGGWISPHRLSGDQVKEAARYIRKKFKPLVWRMNPYDESLRDIRLPGAKPDFTQALDLSVGFDRICRAWTKGHYAAAKQARKKGVEIRKARSLEDWKAYFECYLDSIRRWGDRASSRYEWDFFHSLFRLQSKSVILWLAQKGDRIVSGALCFYHNRHAVYWHAASREGDLALRPAHLLQYEIIKDAVDRHYRWYDFNPSGGHQGVAKFKKGFGAVTLAAPVCRFEAPGMKILKKILRRFKPG